MKAAMIRLWIILGFCTLMSAAATAQPTAACGPYEVSEMTCTQWTSVDGRAVCQPGYYVPVCRPAVDLGDDNVPGGVKKCNFDAQTCVDATPSKSINGYPVSVAEVGGCWEYKRDYTCVSSQVVDTCQDLRDNAKCAVQTRQCKNNNAAMGCLEWEVKYQCLVKAGTTERIEYCGDTTICIGGICWDTGYPPDNDFGQVIADMEAGRQIGVYASNGLNIFGGVAKSCRSKRGGGLKNCCTTDASARTNNAVTGEFLSGAAGFAVRTGSKFVFDTIYGDTLNWVEKGMGAALDAGVGSAGQGLIEQISNPSFSYMGFSIGGTGSFLGTSGTLLAGGSGGMPAIYFNPYAFAFAIAVQVIMSAMTCDEDEAMLAQMRGAGLCSDRIGDWCDKEVLGVCITRRQSYCCYNSKIAKIINVQGREQLGMGWGNTRSPTCDGFTATQLAQIDFSRIDMSEFINDVMAAIDMQYLTGDKAKANTGDFAQKGLESACKKTYEAVGGDVSKLPAECAGLVP